MRDVSGQKQPFPGDGRGVKKCFSCEKHVTFLPKKAEWLSLHLRRGGTKIAHAAAVMDCILTLRSEVKIKFGARESSAAQVPGLWPAMDKESEGFADLGQKLPKISEANLKDRIFVGAQLHQLQKQFAGQYFRTTLNARVWEAFENICKSSLRQRKSENYSEVVLEPISSQIAMGCNMSMKFCLWFRAS